MWQRLLVGDVAAAVVVVVVVVVVIVTAVADTVLADPPD
jgi:hypothetical protein